MTESSVICGAMNTTNPLHDQVRTAQSGLLFFSLTPPKVTTDSERVHTISQNQCKSLGKANIDGLILYDIQDEADRIDKERTFNFVRTIAPEVYARECLNTLNVPKIIYKSIANQTQDSFGNWLRQNEDLEQVVFVGASSQKGVDQTGFSLSDAYLLRTQLREKILLGGVTIPERHARKNDEHLRLFQKIEKGCDFFVSQCVYNLNETKNLLSDYYYHSTERGQRMKPLVFTLAPCGSLKTLQFMEWLGIQVPKWLFNDLKHSKNILEASIETSRNIAYEIMNYAVPKNIPFGFNIESIAIKKEEIEAAHALLTEVGKMTKAVSGAGSSSHQPALPSVS